MVESVRTETDLRAELIRECAAECAAPLAHLLEVARVYGHSLECSGCRRFSNTIENFLALAARHVGGIVRNWESIGVEFDEVLPGNCLELNLLLAACRVAPEFDIGDDSFWHAETDWHAGLRVAGVAYSLRKPGSDNSARGR